MSSDRPRYVPSRNRRAQNQRFHGAFTGGFSAGFYNTVGFNDDTRAFLSIPARHDVWRRGVAVHLQDQITRGYFDMATARDLAQLLATDLARETYNL